jgi:excisionase family DNA binding protein
MQSNNDFLTVDEAAKLTGFSHWSIRRWVGARLTRFESMGRVLVSRAELLELVKPKKVG